MDVETEHNISIQIIHILSLLYLVYTIWNNTSQTPSNMINSDVQVLIHSPQILFMSDKGLYSYNKTVHNENLVRY